MNTNTNSGGCRVEVLLSCMYQEGFDIAYKTKIDSDVLIINQCDRDGYEELQVNGHLWRMIYTTERGSANSRNMALENATGDYVLFCDDDEELSQGYAEIIKKAFDSSPKASCIVFNVNRKNLTTKKKYYVIEKIRKAPGYRGYGFPMLAMKRAVITDAGIKMDTRFGSGAKWPCGDDSLFETDVRKAGLCIYENPAVIAAIDYSQGSQWFQGWNEGYFFMQGAYMKRTHAFISRSVRMLYRCFRTRKDKSLSVSKKIKWIIFNR